VRRDARQLTPVSGGRSRVLLVDGFDASRSTVPRGVAGPSGEGDSGCRCRVPAMAHMPRSAARPGHRHRATSRRPSARRASRAADNHPRPAGRSPSRGGPIGRWPVSLAARPTQSRHLRTTRSICRRNACCGFLSCCDGRNPATNVPHEILARLGRHQRSDRRPIAGQYGCPERIGGCSGGGGFVHTASLAALHERARTARSRHRQQRATSDPGSVG
jgi:hypothetical protein